MMRRGVIAMVLLFWAACLPAQTAVPVPANPELRAAANGVRDAAHERDLALRRLAISIELRGSVAETTIEASFANPTDETLEGDFRLLLPPGAVVSGYALDIGGTMVDGVLVDRPRAKAVYDARVRRGVDPGVAAVTPDNLFETHIHPIPPRGGRRVRLSFVTALGRDGVALPLSIAAPIEGWSVAVQANGVEAAPVVTLAGVKTLAFTRTADGFAETLTGTSALAGELRLLPSVTPETIVSTHRSGERDVQLGGTLVVPDTPPHGERLRIYWNRSRSRLSSDHDAEIAVVRRLIERLRPVSVELVAFNSSGAARTTVATPDAAATWLAGQTYRGATSYAPLAGDTPADRCLLFSEGGPTIDRAIAFAPPCRLDAVSSTPEADRAWLRHVAAAHGGAAYALSSAEIGSLVDALAAPRAGVVAVTDQDGRPLPFVPLDAPAGRWSVLAKAPAGGPVSVRVADATGPHDFVRSIDGPAQPFDGAGSLLGAEQRAALGATEQRDAYVALSRRYGIASPSLSFLVLESPADYLAAKVDPPAGYLADARDAYLRLRKARESDRAQQERRRLDEVAGEWADEVKWWRTRFDPNARPKRVAVSQGFDRTEPVPVSAPPPAPAPPPPPPPPPPAMPAPAIAAGGASDIVVTSARRSRSETRASGPADTPAVAIQIDAWQPDRPYLELYDGKPADFDARFLEAEQRHGSLPIFYLDTAEWLRRHDRTDDAREMVLSALDLPSADEVTLGIVADRLERYGAIDRAVELRERQAALDPDRPQPRRLLALALARRAALSPSHARVDLTRAVELLYGIAITPLDGPWDGIELIALDEANALLPRLHKAGGAVAMDPRLVQLLDADLRVVIDWTTDGSDMDLWVDEPTRERAIYDNPRTAIGGHLSHDITQGYGPEEYLLHKAPPGTYTVQANVYAPDRLDPNGATLLTAHLIRDFGRPSEHDESIDVELKRDERGAKPIGRLVVAAPH